MIVKCVIPVEPMLISIKCQKDSNATNEFGHFQQNVYVISVLCLSKQNKKKCFMVKFYIPHSEY